MKKICLILLIISLQGCAEKDVKNYLAERGTGGLLTKMMNSDGSITKLRQEKQIEKCKGYGFKPETDSFANCMMREEQNRETMAELRALESKRGSNMNKAMNDHTPPMFPPSVHCTSSKMGRDVVTNCR